MTKVEVNAGLLKWAVERSGEDRAKLEQKFTKLDQWITGEDAPTLVQLENFSKATHTPLGYLFLQLPPPDEKLDIPHYRTLTSKSVRAPSTELLDTVRAMERRQDWLREYLKEQGRDPVSLVSCADLKASPITVAKRLAKLLNLDGVWGVLHATWENALVAFRQALTRVGVVVVVNGVVGNNTHRKLNVKEFRGFVLVDQYAPLIFVNGADSKSAQMFTLAHELAHLAFGASAAFDLSEMQPSDDSIERACDQVAAEFLVPTDMLRKVWSRADPDPYETVARTFKVSRLVAGRRLLDLGYIAREEFGKFYRSYIIGEKKQGKGGGNFHNTTPQRVGMRFAIELVRAYQSGRVLPTEAYRLTDLGPKTFDELAKRTQEGAME